MAFTKMFSILLILFSSTSLFGLTFDELKAEVDVTYKDFTLQDWKDKSEYRGVATKFSKQLQVLKPMYVSIISEIRERLRGGWQATIIPIINDRLKAPEELGLELMDDIQHLLDRETRIIDKFATICKEIEMRENGDVSRSPHGTPYYIDYINGDDARTGLNPDTTGGGSWKTITKYTTDTVRTAGDVAYLRANTTWSQGTEAIDILFDESGTIDDFLQIIGCDASTNDPWGDSSDVKPIIDFQNAAYQFYLNGPDYWWFERLDIRQTNDSAGAFRVTGSVGSQWKGCNIQDGNTGTEGFFLESSWDLIIDGCSFLDTGDRSIFIQDTTLEVKNTTFTDGADVGTTYGLYMKNQVLLWLSDCTFSGTFSSGDLYINTTSVLYCRNVVWSASGKTILNDAEVYSEDDDGTFESHISTFTNGTITRGTTSPRAGGADSFAIMAPDADCGPNNPLVLGDKLIGFARIWVATNAASTITIYVRVDSLWDAALTAAECYIKASYLSDGANSDRIELQSTELIANNTNWTALTITIPATNPKRDGWVYVWFYLEEYEDATEKVDVDIKPVIS